MFIVTSRLKYGCTIRLSQEDINEIVVHHMRERFPDFRDGDGFEYIVPKIKLETDLFIAVAKSHPLGKAKGKCTYLEDLIPKEKK